MKDNYAYRLLAIAVIEEQIRQYVEDKYRADNYRESHRNWFKAKNKNLYNYLINNNWAEMLDIDTKKLIDMVESSYKNGGQHTLKWYSILDVSNMI